MTEAEAAALSDEERAETNDDLNVLWEGRYRDLNDWDRRVREAAQSGGQAIVFVWCAGCGQQVGRVIQTGMGNMLVTSEPKHLVLRARSGEELRISEAQRLLGHRIDADATIGFPLTGTETYPARFGRWRSPDPEQVPHVRCPLHGRIEVDPVAVMLAATRRTNDYTAEPE